MFDFHVGHDVTVLVGCGLGGTWLINANVALEPSDAVFEVVVLTI
jgi:cholesterol oxidase